MRAGAGVLMLVTAIVIGVIVRFGYRLWAAEGTESTDRAHPAIAPERRA